MTAPRYALDVVDIQGKISFRHPRPGFPSERIAFDEEEARRFPAVSGLAYADDVVARIDRLREQPGARTLLLRVASYGGAVAAGNEVVDALHRFREAGGKSAALVYGAASCAVPIAVAADVTIVRPDGFFGVHAPSGPDPDRLAALRKRDADLLEERTATPRATIERWLEVRGDSVTHRSMRLDARTALAHGWCDLVSDSADAVVGMLASGGCVASQRAAWLATRDRDLFPVEALPSVPVEEVPTDVEWLAYQRSQRGAPVADAYNHPLVPLLIGTRAERDLTNAIDASVGVRLLATAPSDNLVPNPNSDATPPAGGWPVGSLEQAGRTNYPGAAYQGTYCRKVEALTTSLATLTVTPVISIAEGENVYAEAMIAPEATATNNGSTLLCGRMVVAWINAAGSEFAWASKDPTTSGGYGKVTISAAAPSGATAMILRFEVLGQVKLAYLDNIVLRKTPPIVTGGVSYATGWGDYASYTPPNVRASPGGVGVLTGLCVASAGATSSMFTLPANVRPIVPGYFVVRHTRSGTISMLWAHCSAATGLVGGLSVAPAAGDLVEFYWTFPVG